MLKVRPATHDDIETLCQLGRRTFVDTYTGMGQDRPDGLAEGYANEAFTAELVAERLKSEPHFIAEMRGNPIGYACLTFEDPPDCVLDRQSSRLQRLYVLKEHHGSGTGSALLSECEVFSLRNGFSSIWLGVYEENTKAVEYYVSKGYSEIGKVPWEFIYKGKSYRDYDLVYFKKLS